MAHGGMERLDVECSEFWVRAHAVAATHKVRELHWRAVGQDETDFEMRYTDGFESGQNVSPTNSYSSLFALVALLHHEKTLYSRSTKLCIIRSKTGSNLSKSSFGATKIM